MTRPVEVLVWRQDRPSPADQLSAARPAVGLREPAVVALGESCAAGRGSGAFGPLVALLGQRWGWHDEHGAVSVMQDGV